MLKSVTLRGADLEADARTMARAHAGAKLDAPRLAAQDTARILRRMARTAFAGASPMVGDKRFADSIRVRRMGKGWYRVFSRATYVKGRSAKVDLLWVFDTAPQVNSRNGKGIAVPWQAPVAVGGKRFATPREAEAMGWKLSFLPLKSGKGWLIMGRLAGGDFGKMYGGGGPEIPMYVLLKRGAKMPKRLDLDTIMRQQAPKLDSYAIAAFDRRMARSSLKALG